MSSLPISNATSAESASNTDAKLHQLDVLFTEFTALYRRFQRDAQQFTDAYQRIIADDLRAWATSIAPSMPDSWTLTDLKLADSCRFDNALRDGLKFVSGMEAYGKLALRLNAEASHE